MRSKKGEVSANITTLILSVLVIVILIIFIPIFVSTIEDVENPVTATSITDDEVTYFGIPFPLNNSPLIASSVIAFNVSNPAQIINQSGSGAFFTVIDANNGTIDFTNVEGTGTATIGFNYTANIRQSAGLSVSSIVLLSLIVFLIVVAVIVLAVKKFLT